MSKSLTNSIKSYYTPEVISKTSKLLDEFGSGITKTSDIAISTILNALIDKSNNTTIIDGTCLLIEKLNKTSEGILLNIYNAYIDNEENKKISRDFLALLFDINSDVISTEITNKTFIRKQSTDFIIEMSALLIIAYFSKKGIKKDTIIKLKEDKLKNIQIPEKPANKDVSKPEEVTVTESKSNLKPLLIFVAILGVFGIGYYFMMQSNSKKEEITVATEEPVITDTETQPQVISSKDATKLGEYLDFTLPNDAILHIPTDGIENGLLKMILNNSTSLDDSNFWLIFDGINFDGRETEFKIDSEAQIKNLAEILNSFPKVKIKIASYTDNLGDPTSNKNLSLQRSNAVRNALVKLGVQQNRISTEGFGQEFPIATNDTEEGRADNRRISLKLMEK